MADDKDINDSEVFEIDRIRQLIELMKEHDLSEVDLRHAPRRIRLRRGQQPVSFSAPMPMMPAAAPAPAAAAPAAEAPSEESAAPDNSVVISSPMVGTFYSKPKPEEPAFVKVGDQVEPDTVVCLIEAMKMFNEIPAGVSGKVVEVLAKNEEAVDVNRPLFRVVPS